jgi:hypothetical protein
MLMLLLMLMMLHPASASFSPCFSSLLCTSVLEQTYCIMIEPHEPQCRAAYPFLRSCCCFCHHWETTLIGVPVEATLHASRVDGVGSRHLKMAA